MKKHFLKTALFSIMIVLVLGILTTASCVTFSKSTTPSATSSPTATAPATSSTGTWTPPLLDTSGSTASLPNFADIIAAVKPSVVAINTEVVSYDFFNQPYTQQGAGSGWVIDPNGIIVTNNHVVEGATNITVTMDDGTTYTADPKNVFTDPLSDLAIIKVDAKNLPALKIGSSSNMHLGDWVLAIGNSLGQGIRATEGIISQTGVSLDIQQNETLYNLIETSAAINPGNSGGPLVNLAGEVIGITSAKIASVGVEAMGYAISSDTAMPILEELVNKGYISRPWIGVGLYTVDQLAIMQLNLKVDKGAVVVQVAPNSPADKAGLREGDVIVGIGGQVVNTVQDLTNVLHASKIGQPLEIQYYRGNTKYTTTVVPIESPKATATSATMSN